MLPCERFVSINTRLILSIEYINDLPVRGNGDDDDGGGGIGYGDGGSVSGELDLH